VALVVQKYGGSSLATPEHLKLIALRITEEAKKGNQVVVVVSAMGDTTDHLIQLADKVCKHPPEREMDMLLSVGERISISLLAMAIHELGMEAISYTGSQVGIITDNKHTEARILEIRATRMLEALNEGKIVIVAGFQGVSLNKEITTLGRGGSDTTAIALAAALKADRCEIMKDVDGIYVADPKLVPHPQLNQNLSYDEMIEMAAVGAGVLKTESVELARDFKIKIAIGSSFTGKVGTIISNNSLTSSISGIVGQKDLCTAYIEFKDLSVLYNFNFILNKKRVRIQSYFASECHLKMLFEKRYKAFFTTLLTEFKKSEGIAEYSLKENKGSVSIIGTGLNFYSQSNSNLFETLKNINLKLEILQITPLRVSFIIPTTEVDQIIPLLYNELVTK
jgi:aspartate kinase